jgi:hypothetical protein
LKISLACFINLLFTLFPQNLIGCGWSEDPYDFYTSFFSKALSRNGTYEPFFYTPLVAFNDGMDGSERADATRDSLLLSEWQVYSKKKAARNDINALLYGAPAAELKELYQRIKEAKSPAIQPALQSNTLAQQLAASKNAAAVYYILFAQMFAKATVPRDWETYPSDTAELQRLLAIAAKQHAQTKDAFLKKRYAYQLCKLNFYSGKWEECVRWHDQNFKTTSSVISGLALSYKGGSLYRLKRYEDAAYTFSKVFTLPYMDKQQVYLGFDWSTGAPDEIPENRFIQKARNKKEKAMMLGMFSLSGEEYRLEELQQVYALDPASPLLPVIVNREVNKLELNYLTPLLDRQKGGKAYYNYGAYDDYEREPIDEAQKQHLVRTRDYLATIARKKNSWQTVYGASAAYLSYINKDYTQASEWIDYTRKLSPAQSVKDQLHMIALLVQANQQNRLDSNLEEQLLPDIKWLRTQASKNEEYKIFFRNFFSEIIAQRYEQQGEAYKAALAYGMADIDYYELATWFTRDEMSRAQLLQLYALMTKDKKSGWWQYITSENKLKVDEVIDVVGTAHLRDFRFAEAVEWLSRAKQQQPFIEEFYSNNKIDSVLINPFNVYISEYDRYRDPAKEPYTKLRLAKAFVALQQKASVEKDSARKVALYFQMANGYYNLTYYGNAHEALVWYRPSSEWYNTEYKYSWHRNYYGAYTAQAYYEKAMRFAKDPELRAQCLFFIARCTQKQKPEDATYTYAGREWKHMYTNPLFHRYVKEYGNTKFFRYSFDECSYLADFVNAKK